MNKTVKTSKHSKINITFRTNIAKPGQKSQINPGRKAVVLVNPTPRDFEKLAQLLAVYETKPVKVAVK